MELSTYVKNELKKKGFEEKVSQTYGMKLLDAIDDELLEGIYKFAKEKNKELYKKEQQLDYRERDLEKKEKRLESQRKLLEEQKAAINEMASFTDDRSRNGLLFAQKMADILRDGDRGLGEQGQESLSYIMWAFFVGDSGYKEQFNPMKELREVCTR